MDPTGDVDNEDDHPGRIHFRPPSLKKGEAQENKTFADASVGVDLDIEEPPQQPFKCDRGVSTESDDEGLEGEPVGRLESGLEVWRTCHASATEAAAAAAGK